MERQSSRLYTEAIKWHRLAAEQRYAFAQNALGVLYAKGNGPSQDYTEAIKWYRLAAEQGHSIAQFNLGALYENGNGVSQNYIEAIKWYRLAAAGGYAGAQFELGTFYKEGRHVEQDLSAAIKWYVQAAEQGHASAQSCLSEMFRNDKKVALEIQEALNSCDQAAAPGESEVSPIQRAWLFNSEDHKLSKPNSDVQKQESTPIQSANEIIENSEEDRGVEKQSSKTHGYVYAFFHDKQGWLKLGMTEKSDQKACWGRMRDYARQHKLPPQGWEFQTFMAVYDAYDTEQALHKAMRHMKVRHDTATELFSCSPTLFVEILLKHEKLLDLASASPDDRVRKLQAERKAIQRAQQERREKLAAEIAQKKDANAAARSAFNVAEKQWQSDSTPLLEVQKLRESRVLGRMGYIFLTISAGGLTILNQGQSLGWVAIVGIVALVMWFIRRSQIKNLDIEISKLDSSLSLRPELKIPFPDT